MKLLNFELPPDGFKRLFYDIETSPNIGFFWGAGYKVNISHDNIIKERAIICICYKWEGQDTVHSIEWNKGCDKALLSHFMEVAKTADELVAHNGDNFDEKWIRTRCLVHGIECPPKLNSYDTLKKTRTHFRFNSNRLDYLGKILLREGKINTNFDLWKRICLDNEPSAMREMVQYCKKDVELLERIWKKLAPYDTPKTHAGVFAGLDRWTCPHCASENVKVSKTRPTPKGIVQKQMQCKDCHRYYTIANKVYKDYVVAKFPQEST